MNGPQHFAEAEKLLESAYSAFEADAHRASMELAAHAQVHATLALAAATAMSGINHMDGDDFREWDKVAGVQPDGDE